MQHDDRSHLTIRWPVMALLIVLMMGLFVAVISEARAGECVIVSDGIALWCCSSERPGVCRFAGWLGDAAPA